MSPQRFACLILLLTSLMMGCSRDNEKPDCSEFKAALESENLEQVRVTIDEFIVESGALTYSRENLEKLVQYIDRNCDVKASIICWYCGETNPLLSQVRISFFSKGGHVRRVLNLSHHIDDDKMWWFFSVRPW